jgi:hypothetical protein
MDGMVGIHDRLTDFLSYDLADEIGRLQEILEVN